MMKQPLQLLLFPLLLFLTVAAQSSGAKNTIPVHVGVVLDTGSLVGKTGRTSISIAVEDFYARHANYTTRLVFHTKDSTNTTIGAVSAALDLLQNEQVQAILGPQRSAQAVLISDLGNMTRVPIISFSATSPSLTSSHPPYFIRTAANDSSQVNAIASIVKAFGWRQVVPIYEDTTFGTGIIPYLIDALQGVDARVPYRSMVPLGSTDEHILQELYKLKTMQTRVFIVHMSPTLGSRLFMKAKEVGMMKNGYVWIMTDGLTSVLDSMGTLALNSMQGVLGVKHYVPQSKELDDFNLRWEKRFRQENPDIQKVELSIYGMWAYDTVRALATAVEESGTITNFSVPNPPTANSTLNLNKLGISTFGSKLRDAILRTEFEGIAGEFHLIDNQLQFSTFQIINVNGRTGREIGFWTPSYGLSRTLVPSGRNTYSASVTDIGVVLWPGESTSVPKGWEIPTDGKKLKIGVPVKDGFGEFITAQRDRVTNATKVTGYCIDIFEAVVQKLPYALSYEYIPFEDNKGEMAGSYTDLVKQVNLSKYDAVVGDTTITANRSEMVDFTLPFTESGVAMIVPVTKDPNKSAWIFLRPLTLDLWLASLAFFLYTGFAVWFIEHRVNLDFRGTPWQQLGIIFYFIFSTLVFAHRQNVMSNLSRMVVIVWVFVVLVLTSSFTASLTAIFTVAKLQPTVTDIQQLINNRDRIGYHKVSFLEGLLSKTFDKSRLVPLSTPEQYVDALRKGSSSGGVSVVFHEIPYIKLFLSRYCNGYTMSEPTHKTAGFGFVFPRGSVLVPDISRAILNVTEGDTIARIEKKWFGDVCLLQESSSPIDPHGLTFRSFWGLFLITGATSLIAVLIYLAKFLYKEWGQLKDMSKDKTVLQKILAWMKHFDQKYHQNGLNDEPTAAQENSSVRTRSFINAENTRQADGSQSPMSISDTSPMNLSPQSYASSSHEIRLPHNGASQS